MQKTVDKLNEEAKFNEMVIESANVKEMRLPLLEAIYSKTMGSKVDFTNDSELRIDLSDAKGKFFFEIELLYLLNTKFNTANNNHLF